MLPNPNSEINAARWTWLAPSFQEKRQTGGSKVLVLRFGPEGVRGPELGRGAVPVALKGWPTCLGKR